jgi:H+/gluconate symporter-like permease
MNPWPAICTAAALAALLVLIIRYRYQAFVALLAVSLGLGLAAGLPPLQVVAAMGKGIGDILAGVTILLALGAMLGRILDASGAAEVIARTLVRSFGVQRASLAILVAAYLIGIPILFNVAFLLLMPIMYRLQRETGKSLLWFALPLICSTGTMHSLVPPHPGIVGAVRLLSEKAAQPSTIMIETIVFGTLMGIPVVLVGWYGYSRSWAAAQFIAAPDVEGDKDDTVIDGKPAVRPPSFAISVLIVTLPLVLSLLGFGAKLLADLNQLPEALTRPLVARYAEPERMPFDDEAGPESVEIRTEQVPPWLLVLTHRPVEWLQFLGDPSLALLVPTGLAFWLLGWRRGLGVDRLAKLAGDGLNDVGSMLFLFGAAGAFKQVIQATGAGDYIAAQAMALPLSPVAVAYLVAVLMRLALGSATAAILTASALLAGMAASLPGQETLLILAVANGVTFATQPADSGFWLVKEYCRLSVRDVMLTFNGSRVCMSLTGFVILLAVEWWLRR